MCADPGYRPASAATSLGERFSSCAQQLKLPLAVSRESQTRADIFFRQQREVMQNLFMTHPGSQILEHIRNRHPQPPNRWLAAALARLDGDDARVIHAP